MSRASPLKVCFRCKEPHPREAFLDGYCRPCRREYRREWRSGLRPASETRPWTPPPFPKPAALWSEPRRAAERWLTQWVAA